MQAAGGVAIFATTLSDVLKNTTEFRIFQETTVAWLIEPNLGNECATMTIDATPVDYSWSMTVYDVEGWLVHPYQLRNAYNTTPSEDDTLTFHCGCGEDKGGQHRNFGGQHHNILHIFTYKNYKHLFSAAKPNA